MNPDVFFQAPSFHIWAEAPASQPDPARLCVDVSIQNAGDRVAVFEARLASVVFRGASGVPFVAYQANSLQSAGRWELAPGQSRALVQDVTRAFEDATSFELAYWQEGRLYRSKFCAHAADNSRTMCGPSRHKMLTFQELPSGVR
jgi:hypothetical protein